jgi:hypothetical protein
MSRRAAIVVLALAVGLATAVSPFASAAPDGLERVAQEQGFARAAEPPGAQAPLPGYAVPGVEGPRVATGLAGFAGTLAVFALGHGLARVMRRRSRTARAPA